MQLFQSNENCRPEWKLTNLTLNTALEDCIELIGLVMHWGAQVLRDYNYKHFYFANARLVVSCINIIQAMP
jgi:hypothetical protein